MPQTSGCFTDFRQVIILSNSQRLTKKLFYAAFAVITAAVIGCSSPTEEIRDLDHLSGKKIVVQEGTTFDTFISGGLSIDTTFTNMPAVPMGTI